MKTTILCILVFAAIVMPIYAQSQSPFSSFKDIPGVTEGEINAIEALRDRYDHFSYGMMISTEAFLKENGKGGGYTALLCEWLTELFGIRFQLEICALNELLPQLNNGDIDFAGNVRATSVRAAEEYERIYYMTDTIMERQYKRMRLAGSHSLQQILIERPPRYAFLEGYTTPSTVALIMKSVTHEAVWVKNFAEAYSALENGDADAFVGTSAVEAGFITYGNVYSEDFFPLIFSPVSMATAKQELRPVISVMNKALRGGARPYLSHLYNRGYREYMQYKMVMLLSDEERAYIDSNPVIPVVASYNNYPDCFYNTREKEWQGIFFDLMKEVSSLTGLSFELVHDEHAEWPDIYEMLKNGFAALSASLPWTKEREEFFIWSKTALLPDHYTLISRSNYPNITIPEVLNAKVGASGDTATMFRQWFPSHTNIVEYGSMNEAVDALQRGEVDMALATERRLLLLTHYLELPDYKINIVFDQPIETVFGFNKNEAVLRSIIDKALQITNTNEIADQWMRKTYDYRAKVAEARLPWLIGASVLLLLTLLLTLALFSKTRNEEKQLARLVKEISEADRLKNISLNLMERVLNSLDSMIYVNDPVTYEILFINDNMKRQFGITDDCIGQLCYKIFQKDFDKRCDFCPCIQLEKDPGKTVIWEEHNSLTNLIYRNTDRYIDWPNGKKVHIQHSIDMTELIAAKEFAEQSSRYKSSFLATVSHEIRTPMNAILGITEIQMQNESSPELNEALGKIHQSGYLLLGIINDILDLSKIEAGKLELVPVKYDVASLIHDTIHLNIMRYENKPIEVNLQVDENIPSELFGDELRIKQILNNLLSNAFKYTDSGEVSLWATIEHPPEEESKLITLVFHVSDTGQGMTTDQVSKLFDEYTRFNLEANRATTGTGLGMSITQHLIKMMNGGISVESEPGKGSAFTVRLPQETVGAAVLGKEIAENLQRFHLGQSSHREKAPHIVRDYMPYGRVLIVDDVETNLYVARGLMAPYGLSIETAESGFEAIDKVKSGASYDIIFMDHFMPKMDGMETTRHIRELGYKNPIVALTANALTGQAEVFLENGFDGFISKPIDIRQLNAVLNQSIRDKYPDDIVEAARRLKDDLRKHSAGGGKPMDTQLAKIFMRDGQKALTALEAFYEKKDAYDDKDIQQYIINSHSMKSALAIIGESDLSVFAAKLEQAGRDRNMAVIADETPVFLSSLRAVIEKIKPREDAHSDTLTAENRNFLREKLIVIQGACVKYDKKTAKDAVAELQGKIWPVRVTEQLESIADRLLHSEFEEASKLASADIM